MDNGLIVSVTGVIFPYGSEQSPPNTILIGDRASSEEFHAGVRNRFVSERVEEMDGSLLAVLNRGSKQEAGVSIYADGFRSRYLGDTTFERNGKKVLQICFGAPACSYRSPIPDTEEMKNLRFEPVASVLKALNRQDPYEAKMIDWINMAVNLGLVRHNL